MLKKWVKAWRNMSAKEKTEMASEVGYNRLYIGQVMRGEHPGGHRLIARVRDYFKGQMI